MNTQLQVNILINDLNRNRYVRLWGTVVVTTKLGGAWYITNVLYAPLLSPTIESNTLREWKFQLFDTNPIDPTKIKIKNVFEKLVVDNLLWNVL